MFKRKIEPNENLVHIFDYINNNPDQITWTELIQMAIDYECYKELFLNHVIINYLLVEHNERNRKKKENNINIEEYL